MATQTTNYGFTLPNYDEIADIDVINENMDLIDKQMKRNADGVVQAKSIVSDAYSGSLTYNVGDYCIYDNKLYRCITAVTTAEAFDSAKWQETSVKSELSTLNSNLSGMMCVTNEVNVFNDNFNAYEVKEYGVDVPNIEGYTAIGIVGLAYNNVYTQCVSFWINANKLHAFVYNTLDTTFNNALCNAIVLYTKKI